MGSILGEFGEKIKAELSDIFKTAKKKAEAGKVKQLYADCVIRNSKGQILLLQRSFQDDFMEGKWCLAGGKIEDGELPEVAAVRELEEETAISSTDLTGFTFLKNIDKENCTIHYFTAVVPDDVLIVLDNNEHYRYQFVSEDKIGEYELILDLNEALTNEIIPILPTDLLPTASSRSLTPEEETLNHNFIVKSFDEGMISDDDFAKYLQVKGAIDTITKAYDQDLISNDQFFNALEKGKHYEFIKVERDGKTFYQYRQVGTDKIEEDVETGTTIDTNSALDLQITKYSDKSILITGDTYKNLQLLRDAKEAAGGYGTFNKTLGGWIFPLFAKDKIIALLADKMSIDTYDETVAKEQAIEAKNTVDIGTPVVDPEGNEAEVTGITNNEDGKAVYTIDVIGEDGTETIEITEDQLAIPPATDEKAEDLINNATEESRFKTGKMLMGKEAGEQPVSSDVQAEGSKGIKAEVKEFTTRSGEKVQALDYGHIRPKDIMLVEQEGILDKARPDWCPVINEKNFYGHKDDSFLFDYVKLDEDRILLSVNGFDKSTIFAPKVNHLMN
jgi:mutator protein MutT